MLNLVCHLSGIATTTAAWVDAVAGTDAKIRDTRKTLPGLRALQKYAVRVGGGVNHRMGLGDAALIKDNHVAAAGSVLAALREVRSAAPDLPCEVEVDSLEQLDDVLSRERRTRTAGQLSGLADADRGAAPRRPSARHHARILRRTFVGHRRRVRRDRRRLPGRRRPHPFGAGARCRTGRLGWPHGIDTHRIPDRRRRSAGMAGDRRLGGWPGPAWHAGWWSRPTPRAPYAS